MITSTKTMDPFIKLKDQVSVELSQVNNLIISLVQNKEELVGLITNYLLNAGGKRIRPILTIVCAKLCGYIEGNSHTSFAAAVEFIHNATLLHDDVVDNSELRRGRLTANHKWGNKSSILVGDFLLSQAFQLMVKEGSLEILNILSKTSAIIAEGEIMQLSSINNAEINLNRYLKIISTKTAELFASACEIGAIIADDKSKQSFLREFGINFGIAFQIADDIIDYIASKEQTGKFTGKDFMEGKITLPVILAYKKANLEEQNYIKQIFSKSERLDSELTTMISLIKKYHCFEESYQFAAKYTDKAKKSLEIFADDNNLKQTLVETLDFCITRVY